MQYQIEGLDKLLKNFKMSSDKALLYCGEYLASKLKEQVEKDSYDLGNLANSITYRKARPGVVEVGSNLVYAPVREYGRKPGTFPNLDALVGRTARKKMIKGGATQSYDSLHYTDKGVVFLVARAIATRGIEGKYTFKKVLQREKQNVLNLYHDLLVE